MVAKEGCLVTANEPQDKVSSCMTLVVIAWLGLAYVITSSGGFRGGKGGANAPPFGG